MNHQQPQMGAATSGFSKDLHDAFVEVVDKIHDALVCISAEGLLTSHSARFSQLLGTNVADAIGAPFEKFVNPADREVWRSFCNMLQSTGQDVVRNIQLLAQSGTYVPVAIRGVRLRPQDGRLPGIMIVFSDLTEVCQAQQQTTLLTQLLDHTRFEAILMFNKEGAITECNQTAEHFFGKSREMLIGEDVRDLFRTSDSDLFDFDGVVKIVETSRETLANGAYNKPVPSEISVVRFIDVADRRHVGMAFVRDLSELKSLERLKDEFLNVTSHELRTPLSIITAAIGSLSDGVMGVLPKGQKQMVGRIRENCDRLGRLINNLLDFSSLVSGRAQMRKEPVNMADVVQNAVKGLLHMVREKGVEIDLDMADELPWVFVDADMIARVVTNLVTNAIRHASSHITVSVEHVSPDSVRVTVGDDGPGLKKKDMEQLFDKFVQINRKHGGAGYKGTGLGLAICKHIMDAHEGKIWVESSEGRGSRFSFSLPVYDEKKQLRTFLGESIAAAAANNVPMSIVTILATSSLNDADMAYGFFGNLKRLLQEKTFRKTDTIFLLKDPLCLVLTVQEGRSKADNIMQRINDAIHELKKKKRTKHITFTLGFSVYPDEAQDSDSLFQLSMRTQTELPNRRRLWQLSNAPRVSVPSSSPKPVQRSKGRSTGVK